MLSPQEALRELDIKVQRVIDAIEVIKERQEDMSEHVAQVHDALYDPDKGLYARVREIEAVKSTTAKLMWLAVTSLIAMSVATWYQHLI